MKQLTLSQVLELSQVLSSVGFTAEFGNDVGLDLPEDYNTAVCLTREDGEELLMFVVYTSQEDEGVFILETTTSGSVMGTVVDSSTDFSDILHMIREEALKYIGTILNK